MDNEILKKYQQIYTSDELKELQKIQVYFAQNEEEHQAHHKLFLEFLEEIKKSMNNDPSGEIGKDMAQRWINLHRQAWQKAYEQYPKAEKIIKEKHDQWVAAGLHETLWGKGAYEWLLNAFKLNGIPFPS